MSGDEIWRRDEIESPCVKICVVHPGAGVCVGCWRTLEEIGAWSAFSPAERREIMAALPDRKALLKAKAARPSSRRNKEA